jgi:small subunit ribosomal protein S20
MMRGDPGAAVANHKSAKKRAQQDERRRMRNRAVKSRVRTLIKSLRQSIESGDREAIPTRLREAERALRKAASRGVIAKRSADRSVSRLARAARPS